MPPQPRECESQFVAVTMTLNSVYICDEGGRSAVSLEVMMEHRYEFCARHGVWRTRCECHDYCDVAMIRIASCSNAYTLWTRAGACDICTYHEGYACRPVPRLRRAAVAPAGARGERLVEQAGLI